MTYLKSRSNLLPYAFKWGKRKFDFLNCSKIVSEYYQEIPQSQTADKPKSLFSLDMFNLISNGYK